MPRTITDFEYDAKTDTMDRPQNNRAKESLNTKRANEAVGERRRQRAHSAETKRTLGTKKNPKVARPTATPKVATPKAPNMLNRPLPGSGAMKLGGKALGAASKFTGVVGTGIAVGQGAYEGTKAIMNSTDRGRSNMRNLVDKISDFTGLNDKQNALLSNDPGVSDQAVDDYKNENRPAQEGLAGQEPGAGQEPTYKQDGQAGPPTDDDATQLGVYEQSRPADNSVNAGNPEPIANSSYEFAGKYGDTDVITRPAVDGQGERYEPNVNIVDGERVETAVPEFTDQQTAQGIQRPGVQSQEDIATENARIEQSRADYQRNTTMSDGRRAFGGSATEELREAQLDASAEGRDSEVLSRQLAEEGRTPEQRAAYAADPAGAYNVDASAEASNAKSQLESFKHNFQMAKDTAAVGDRRQTEGRRAATDAAKQATRKFDYLTLLDPQGQSDLELMANQMFSGGEGGSMPDILSQIQNSIEFDENGVPLRDPETGSFVPKPNMQLESQGQRPEVSVHI